MTKHEAAVVMAYTGIAMCCGDNWGVYHKYVQNIMGRPVWTHEMASEKVAEQIKELSKPDFLEICKNLTDDISVAPVVHGRWDCGDDMFEYAICSSCKWDSGEAWEYAKKNFKFCPHCGAKMDESEDSGNV